MNLFLLQFENKTRSGQNSTHVHKYWCPVIGLKLIQFIQMYLYLYFQLVSLRKHLEAILSTIRLQACSTY